MNDRTQKTTVLCVDDEEVQLHVRRLLFESDGYVVVEARSTTGALQEFQRGNIDVVVMDYSLFGGEGTKVAEQMKELRPLTPIIILSGFTSLPESSSVDLWLRKMDTDPDELLDAVKQLTTRRKVLASGQSE